MKITSELLKALGFKQQKNNNGIEIDEWRMTGYCFIIRSGPLYWDFSCVYHHHEITDLEELFSIIYADAFEAGQEDTKQKLREFLGVEKRKTLPGV